MPPKVLNLPHLNPNTLKTKSIFSSILLLTLFAFSAFATTPVKHKYSFTVRGLHNTKCFLGFYYGDKSYVLDSSAVDEKGNFSFQGDSLLPGGVYFILLKDKRYFEFIIDKEQHFAMRTDSTDFVKFMKVEGSPENQLFYDYLNYAAVQYQKLKKMQDSLKTPAQKMAGHAKMDSLNNAVKKYKEDFIAHHPEMFVSEIFKAAEYPDVPETPTLPNGRKDSTFGFRYYKSHFFDNINFSDDRMVHTPQQIFFDRVKEYFTKLTFQVPDSINAAADYILNKARRSPDMFKFLVNWISFTYESSNIMGMDAVFVHMVETYYTPQIATWESPSHLDKMIERAKQLEPILIGKPAIPLVLPDTANVMTDMEAGNARYTVLIFWDYDCGLCQREIPKLKKWYDSVKGQGYEVYAVEIAENLDIQKWKEYIRKHNLNWINVADISHTSNFRHDYDVISTPMIYILNEDKRIIAKKIDVIDLNGVLRHDMLLHSGGE
jgi:alkyl hydroperoxide reductase subunit AhpC